MSHNPEISVIVTTYNRKELLTETVLSILSQTYRDFELIIVDNYSNYDFPALIQSFNDERIKAFQNINNGVIAINRNFGIKLSKGEYIALCDDDDLWEPEKLQEQIDVMNKHPSVGLTCTDVTFINLNKNHSDLKASFTFFKKSLLSTNAVSAKYLLIFLTFITNSSVLFKSSLVQQIGYINEDPNFKTIEDYEYWFRMAQHFDIYYIHKKLVRYRLHDQQLSLVNKHVFTRTLSVVKANWSKLNILQKIIYMIKKTLN